MRSDITPGATFPDYELPDHTRTPRRLSELQGDDPLILTLARGHYCPKEHQQHLELVAAYPKIAVAYTQIVTISTDEHHASQEFRASVGAPWPFLSDPGRIVQQDLEIQEYTDPDNDPMIPHTLVLKPGPGSRPSTNCASGIVDVFDVTIVSAPRWRSIVAYRSRFTARSSNTASITQSAVV